MCFSLSKQGERKIGEENENMRVSTVVFLEIAGSNCCIPLCGKNMDFIANGSFNLYSFAILTNRLCFHRDRTMFNHMIF